MSGFATISAKNRELADGYVTIGGKWRKITDGWAVKNGVWQQAYSSFSIDKVLNNNSWNVISQAAALGLAPSLWSVGDCKAVALNGTIGTLAVSETYYVYIIGFNHNDATNAIDFGTFKTALSSGIDVCLVDSSYGKQDRTTGKFLIELSASGNKGWVSTHMRTTVLGSDSTPANPTANTFLAALPNDLRAVMKPMTIYTDNKANGSDTASNVTATTDYLPLLAEFEIFGSRNSANSAEQNYQKQYAYYANGNGKVKYKHNETSSAAYWWGRSCRYNYNVRYCYVTTSGAASDGTKVTSYGVAPIFRV